MYVRATATKPKDDTNAVHLSVSYTKGKGIVVCGYPSCVKPDGGYTIALSMMVRTPEALLEPRKANSKARLAHWETEARRQLDARSGPTWDVVTAVCAQNGLVDPH